MLRRRCMSASQPTEVSSCAPAPSAQILDLANRGALVGFLACTSLVLVQTALQRPLPGPTGWAEGLMVISATISTLLTLARPLPGTKVLLAAGLIALGAGGIQTVGVMTAFPFGPFSYGSNAGPKMFGVLPWWTPLMWVVAVLTARGVARLILRPWRKTKLYGFWVMGGATGFTVLWNLGAEPFATRVATYWFWQPTKLPLTWHHMPATNSLGWGLTTLLLLAFCTPLLINKYPRSRKHRVDYQPLLVWNAFLLWFGLAAGLAGLTSATMLCSAAMLLPTMAAIRGARW